MQEVHPLNIEQFFADVLHQDERALRGWFHPDACIRWICSNERFTVEEYIRANCEYPGEWDGKIERVVREGDHIIAACHVFPTDRSASFHVVSFLQISGGRIAAMDEYWSDDAPPPQWRLEMGIGRKIDL